MGVIQHSEFKLPTVNQDVKGKLPALDGRIWYNLIEKRAKYKKEGKDVTVADLEELQALTGSELIGVESRLGATLQEVITNLTKLTDQASSNIKWRKEVKYTINYIKKGPSDVREIFVEGAEDGERLLDIVNKKYYIAKNGMFKRPYLVKEEDSFIFKDNGKGKPESTEISPLATNNIYKGLGLVEIQVFEGYTCRVEEEEYSFTYCNTEWVQSFSMGDHDTLAKVKGGDSNGCYHITEEEAKTVKQLNEERINGRGIKVFKKGPFVFSNPTTLKHNLKSRQLNITVQKDMNGLAGDSEKNFTFTPKSEDVVEIRGIAGKYWIFIVSISD